MPEDQPGGLQLHMTFFLEDEIDLSLNHDW